MNLAAKLIVLVFILLVAIQVGCFKQVPLQWGILMFDESATTFWALQLASWCRGYPSHLNLDPLNGMPEGVGPGPKITSRATRC